MWVDQMPGSDSYYTKRHHIFVKIRRSTTEGPNGVPKTLSTTLPARVTGLHAIQIGSLDDLGSFIPSSGVDGEGEGNYHSWEISPTGIWKSDERHLALIMPERNKIISPGLGELSISAGSGPIWEAERQYIAFVEFEGGQVLRSNVGNAGITT